VWRLTGGILGYFLHIGKFWPQRRLGRRQAIIEVEKKSQIGHWFGLGLNGITFGPEILVNPI
jgi:hypothetical protein